MSEKKPHNGGKTLHTQQYKFSILEIFKTIVKTSSFLQKCVVIMTMVIKRLTFQLYV
jgi:hypothetical protein